MDGTIGNCPAIKKGFGNITTTTLKGVAQTDSFRKMWSITKSATDTCSQCEFRFACTDCRAFVEGSGDSYGKPTKCRPPILANGIKVLSRKCHSGKKSEYVSEVPV